MTYLNYIHSHKKRKGSLETQAVLLIFLLELGISGVAYTEYIEIKKKAAFREDFLNGDDFHAVLASFCSYDYVTNVSEAAEKIATDEKDYRKCSLSVYVL